MIKRGRKSSTSQSSGEEQDLDGKKKAKKKNKKKKKHGKTKKKKKAKEKDEARGGKGISDDEDDRHGKNKKSRKKVRISKLNIDIDGVQAFSDLDISEEEYAPPKDLSPRSAAEYVKARLKEAAKKRAKKKAGKKVGQMILKFKRPEDCHQERAINTFFQLLAIYSRRGACSHRKPSQWCAPFVMAYTFGLKGILPPI